MKIKCFGCGEFEFEIDVALSQLRGAPIVALTCPKCGNSTSIQERPGGGLEIALDKHLRSERSKA